MTSMWHSCWGGWVQLPSDTVSPVVEMAAFISGVPRRANMTSWYLCSESHSQTFCLPSCNGRLFSPLTIPVQWEWFYLFNKKLLAGLLKTQQLCSSSLYWFFRGSAFRNQLTQYYLLWESRRWETMVGSN